MPVVATAQRGRAISARGQSHPEFSHTHQKCRPRITRITQTSPMIPSISLASAAS